MKFLLVAIFVFFFVAMPMYLLNTFVMPQVQNLQQVYANAGHTADAVAQGAAQPQH